MRRKIWAEVFLNVLDVSSFKTISIPNEEKKYMKTGPLFILFKKKKEKKTQQTLQTPQTLSSNQVFLEPIKIKF